MYRVTMESLKKAAEDHACAQWHSETAEILDWEVEYDRWNENLNILAQIKTADGVTHDWVHLYPEGH